MCRLTCVLVICAACSQTTPNAHLSDLPGLSIHTYASNALDDEDDAPPILTVSIGYDGTTFAEAHDGECATLHDVDGTYNGTPLVLASAGAADEYGDCEMALFEARVPVGIDEVGALDVSDGTRTIHATFHAGAIAPRRATLISHAGWKFAPGDTVTATWSHAADLATPVEVRLRDAYAQPVTLVADHTPGTSEIAFQLPGEQPRYELVTMAFVVTGDDPANLMGTADVCTGAERCTYTGSRSFTHYARFP